MTKSAVFSASQWTVRRGDNVSVGPFDLDLQPGEIVTWMGPSGVGKTTVLMSLLGFEDRSLVVSGTRCESGQCIAPGDVPKQALYIPQHLPFNPNWEVRAFLLRLPWNVEKGLKRPDGRPYRRIDCVNEVLKRMGLESRARATVAGLSGGEMQRAAISQMLLLRPRLIACDEFVSALDPGMAIEILDEFRNIVTQTQGGALLALHDVHAAVHVSNRIALMWPHQMDRVPWWLQSGTDLWNTDVIHSLLCVARWSTHHNTKSIHSLVSFLKSWLYNPDPLLEEMNAGGETRAFLVGRNGELQVADKLTWCNVQACSEFQDRASMSPIRITQNGEELIGIAQPLPGQSHLRKVAVLTQVTGEK